MKKNLSTTFSIYYFTLATVSGIFMAILPMYYIQIGLSNIEIAFLSAILFLSTFIQFFLNKVINNVNKWFVISSFIIMLSIVLLAISESFVVIALVLFVSTGFRILIVSLIDDYALKENQDLGKRRKYATIGFGLSGIIYLIMIFFMKPVSVILLFSIILIICSIYLPPYYREKKISKLSQINRPEVIYFNAIFMSVLGLKITYQAIYLNDILLMSVFMVVTVLVEAVVLNYSSRIKIGSKMFVSTVLVICSLIIILLSSSYVAVVLSAIIQGIAVGIYIPSYFNFIKNNSEDITGTIIFSSTLQCIFGFLIALFIILPLFHLYNIDVVMYSFVIITILSYIYLWMKQKTKKNVE